MKKHTNKQLQAMLDEMIERCINNINYFGHVLMEMKMTQEEMLNGTDKDRIVKAQLCSATIEMVTDVLSPAFEYARTLDSSRDKFFDELGKIHETTQKRMKGNNGNVTSPSSSPDSVNPVDISEDQNKLQQ